MLTAADIRRLLDLAPHPEGGWYRETFRDRTLPGSTRAASTAIYFLLEADQVSRWHRVDVAEIWHHYAGAPLELSIAVTADSIPQARRLGPSIESGEAPQIVVPAGAWQQARSLGDWTLTGCTVAPGFSFDAFEIARPEFVPGLGRD